MSIVVISQAAVELAFLQGRLDEAMTTRRRMIHRVREANAALESADQEVARIGAKLRDLVGCHMEITE